VSRERPPADPAALDAWLADREAALGDVRPGAEAGIDWVGEAGVRTPLAVVYLHGFSASRAETAPLPERLAEALGANLFHSRLTGHGRTPAAMGEADAAGWLEDAAEALEIGRRIGERVVLVGTSTGATLATLLAAEAPPDLAALVLIAPNFGPKDRRSFLLGWPGARIWVPWIVGAERVVEPENEAHARGWTTTYPSTALVPMQQLVKHVRRAPLERIAVPVLALWCDADTVVDAGRTRPTLARMTGTRVVAEALPAREDPDVPNPSQHVIVGDAFAPGATTPVLERVLGFLSDAGVPPSSDAGVPPSSDAGVPPGVEADTPPGSSAGVRPGR
jgi:pimeloyl-ACP methyl ester carboxylesterase